MILSPLILNHIQILACPVDPLTRWRIENQMLNPPSQPPVDGLYREHQSWLHNWLRRKLGNADDASDLLQETFLRVLRRPASFLLRDNAGFSPRRQLALIANGLVINKWRRDALEREYLAVLANMEAPGSPSPETRAILLDILCEIDAMLDGLPDKCRRAFLMAQLDGMSHDAIAQELGVTRRSVHNYQVRAMLACSQYLMSQQD
ncbi:sigma-70 family RNA polymerase sigma factor [Kerstersia similis]|uniref:sigma-70 family RNA polymerase sigma factor n=1 Tax=Kerstersia similis TaxID=206505 RepID=UPI0039F0718A